MGKYCIACKPLFPSHVRSFPANAQTLTTDEVTLQRKYYSSLAAADCEEEEEEGSECPKWTKNCTVIRQQIGLTQK